MRNRARNRWMWAAVAGVLLVGGCSDTSGSSIFGQVIGRILTPGGVAADGVTVRLTGTTVAAITDAEGRFQLRGVPEGNWTVTAEVLGGGQTQLAESTLFRFDGNHAVDIGDLRLANAGTGRQLGEGPAKSWTRPAGPCSRRRSAWSAAGRRSRP